MDLFARWALACWALLVEMAPSLWLGFLAAGALGVLLPRAFIQRHLARPGVGSVFKAALLGSPMPLCSCGVMPVANQLRRLGASTGAVSAFLVSTPQTGVENMLVCLALLGPAFAVASPVIAIVSGLLVGLWVQAVGGRTASPADAAAVDSPGDAPPSRLRVFARIALVVLPRDLALPLAFGVAVAGVIAIWVPPASFVEWGGGWPARLAVLAASVPMYVCSAASIPVAASLIGAGLTPGVALIFLVAGPAVNAAAFAALGKVLGLRGAVAHLIGLIACVLAASVLLDLWLVRPGEPYAVPPCHAHASPLANLAAVGLILMMARARGSR
jgi:uncharacterized membrane protein YraQ (UPF0718 family)